MKLCNSITRDIKRYRKLKTNIRNHVKIKVKQITKKQRQQLLDQGRKEGKEGFYDKL